MDRLHIGRERAANPSPLAGPTVMKSVRTRTRPVATINRFAIGSIRILRGWAIRLRIDRALLIGILRGGNIAKLRSRHVAKNRGGIGSLGRLRGQAIRRRIDRALLIGILRSGNIAIAWSRHVAIFRGAVGSIGILRGRAIRRRIDRALLIGILRSGNIAIAWSRHVAKNRGAVGSIGILRCRTIRRRIDLALLIGILRGGSLAIAWSRHVAKNRRGVPAVARPTHTSARICCITSIGGRGPRICAVPPARVVGGGLRPRPGHCLGSRSGRRPTPARHICSRAAGRGLSRFRGGLRGTSVGSGLRLFPLRWRPQ